MNILLLGAAGFIGTNLTMKLAENRQDIITLVDRDISYFAPVQTKGLINIKYVKNNLGISSDFINIVKGQDIIYHLVSTTIPANSNLHVSQELTANVIFTANLLDACVKSGVKKVVFISSGGTVYGKEANCPLKEETPTKPISSYGVQKVTIEKLLYLYRYINGLDYRIIRLANPYGPYQKPDGILGAVSTFTYKALRNEKIIVYGNGSVVRDFIYIEDAVDAILNIVNGENKHRTFNLGCGYGTSIMEVIDTVRKTLDVDINIEHKPVRLVDVPVNYLDISRYEEAYGKLDPTSLEEGIRKTANFMKAQGMV